MPRTSIVIFAQVPPPEHGQSRMVQRTLDALRAESGDFDVHHVNARFSETLEDVGASSLGKLLLTFKYLLHALRLRMRLCDPMLLYVPGPVNWSPVLRDWILLSVLRLFYRRVVFHWHAIGQGEWAHGSERLRLGGPDWLDRCARAASCGVLRRPFGSIAVSESSRKDAAAVSSQHALVVPNGIEDPCPDYETVVEPARQARLRDLAFSEHPCFRILFLSHGTAEKGALDAIQSLQQLLEACPPEWRFAVTFAGGLSEEIAPRFGSELAHIGKYGEDRMTVNLQGYVSGADKQRCYAEHDIFLSPSRWESFGLTVLEAMAYGMHIVAAASDGVSGLLPPCHPYLARVACPMELADKLRNCCAEILANPSTKEGRELRERFLSRYQLADFSGNLVSAFRQLGKEMEARSQRSENSAPAPSAPLATSVRAEPARPTGASPISNLRSPISISVYLADQNPGHDRSFGISRMSRVVIEALHQTGQVAIKAVVSRSSQKPPPGTAALDTLPWGTRGKFVRLLTDHLHPLVHGHRTQPDLYYFPKGYLPLCHALCSPSVVTIHDTIIQYDEDHYPDWRRSWEYAYWSMLLRHTLRHSDCILTVSESSRGQIIDFMERHRIPTKEIIVTYEPCQYETIPQPEPYSTTKENHVIHLASREPHKRSAHLVRWWHEAELRGHKLPMLHLVGTVPPEVEPLLASSRSIAKRPFLDDNALQAAYRSACALILPSEIEGFGLPALEAYYLGTPVCYVKGTSVEEVLSVSTNKGSFTLNDSDSLFAALDEVMQMSPQEIRACGLKLRECYAAEKVARRMLEVFRRAAGEARRGCVD